MFGYKPHFEGALFMADYKQMYSTLFRKVTKAIVLLQEAQIETEELFISANETDLQILPLALEPTRNNSDDIND